MAVGTARRALQQRQAAFFSMLRRIRVMHAHPTRKPVFYLFLQSGDIRKGDIALISVAARNGGGKTPVAVARVCIIVVGVGHLFGKQVLAPTVHQHGDRGGAADDRADARVPDELRISGNRDAPVLKRFARFPLPARGTYGGGKQIYGGGTAHVVCIKAGPELEQRSTAGRTYIDHVGIQISCGVFRVLHRQAGAAQERTPFAVGHPGRPRPGRKYAHGELHRGAGGRGRIPRSDQRIERGGRNFRCGVAASLYVTPGILFQAQRSVCVGGIFKRAGRKGFFVFQNERMVRHIQAPSHKTAGDTLYEAVPAAFSQFYHKVSIIPNIIAQAVKSQVTKRFPFRRVSCIMI